MYFERLIAWGQAGKSGTGPKAIFYFEAFDEPWKQGDDKWGLFNVNRQARYVIQEPGDSAKWVREPVASSDANGVYEASDAVYFIPPVVNAAVTQNRYVIYSEAVTVSDFNPTGLVWDPYVKTFWQTVSDPAFGDGTQSYEIDPRPETWGWGMLYQSRANVTANLSAFASGTLNFSIKTTYGSSSGGKIEIGLSSDSELNGAVESYLQIANGQYGYCNTGSWCKVSIPVQAFVAQNPKLDLSLILSRFVIADRFDITRNTQRTDLPKIYIDGIYWSR
jgi:hypothetical protein